ncbi:MAG: VCBS repeat-containing protein [Gammaproteobacteria bacterium]|nr:VCBS repeat-containing protein [Gammaproteobacteria bacterium]
MTAEGSSLISRPWRKDSPSPTRTATRFLVLTLLLLPWSAAWATFVSTPVTSVRVGDTYRYDVQATGSGTVEITAPNGLPPWLTLTQTGSGTAVLTGVPQSGDSGAGITLRSEDTYCRIFQVFCYDFQTFDITIIENNAPAVVPPGIEDQNLVEGEPFSLDVSGAFQDPDGDPLTFTVTGLPQSVSLGGTVLSGTPTQADAADSPYEVTVTADDGRGGTVSEPFNLIVAPLDRAEISLESIVPAPAPATRGDPVEWVLTIGNAGPSPTNQVDVALVFAGNPFTFGEHGCTLSVEDNRQRLDCSVGPIEAGESATLTIPGSAAQAGDTYVTATIASPGAPIDPSADNNSAGAALNVGRSVAAEAAQSIEGSAAIAAGAGDLDGDGFDEVAAATGAEEPTSLYMNLEDPNGLHATLSEEGDSRRGLSSVPLSLEDAAAGRGVAVGDVDGDGDADLLVANAAGAPSIVFTNDGAGVMTRAAELGAADVDSRGVAAADLDGDGYADAAFANAGADTVYLSRGGAEFAEVTLGEPVLSAMDVAAADVVGDALPDLIFANLNGPATVHENLGGGTFGAAVQIDPGPTSSVAAGDFNGDGHVDLVFGRAAAGPGGLPSNPVYTNNGAGGFVAVGALGSSPTLDVLTADVDGDDALDVIAINATGAHQVFVGDGDGGFDLRPALFVSPGASRAALGRIGLGAGPDVVVAGDKGLQVFFNDSAGNFGLGDTVRPVIELVGDAEITVEVDGSYTDAGATASDDVDGELEPTVDNPVDTKVIGTYTITYSAVDSAGNAAVPVTRTVSVEARDASGGGGGGAAGPGLLLLLGIGWLAIGCARRDGQGSRRACGPDCG